MKLTNVIHNSINVIDGNEKLLVLDQATIHQKK